jgi:uncharacterized membrane protein YeaQ/YmgE (transglycosylase-associated protein family)
MTITVLIWILVGAALGWVINFLAPRVPKTTVRYVVTGVLGAVLGGAVIYWVASDAFEVLGLRQPSCRSE